MDEVKIIPTEIPLDSTGNKNQLQSTLYKKNFDVGSTTRNLFCENRIAGRLLTVEELSSRLGVSKKTIYGWIYRGIIKPRRIGPRLVRFEPMEVEQWISNKGDS